ncbi:MAG TPA: aminoacyl-tRNA hydrolase [Ignavibacteria bacterium]|nr:aminoacyl-tRNA hydrolase [Ignavibacteria bacterium]HMR41912.1 aminoacyl-tRNA hydrolase [Ignavibacteria bacterium]
MKLIIGLGNPGSKYELTRHNIGFIALDFFASFLNIKFSESKGDWLEAKGKIGNEEVYLIKPATYMNNSGIAVREFIERHEAELSEKTEKPDLKNILVVVDDFQIPLGMIRVRKNGSDGGHNGLSSIIYHLNSDEFPRMRIGIGKEEVPAKEEFIDFVLGVFEKDEIEIIKKMIPFYTDCMKSFITDGLTKTMNNYNKIFI